MRTLFVSGVQWFIVILLTSVSLLLTRRCVVASGTVSLCFNNVHLFGAEYT